MNDFESVDFFTDPSLIPDPYPYFDHLRARCPVMPQAVQGVMAITGHRKPSRFTKTRRSRRVSRLRAHSPGLPFEPEQAMTSAS